jgi:sporulation protein YlmC with PRC-barrel domain
VNDAPRTDRLAGPLDGAFSLLDRQLLDRDGRMLGKVDDIELTQQEDGLAITAVLTGPAALLHRLGGRLGARLVTTWERLKVSEPQRTRPWRIEMDRVDRLDSAVHLSTARDGVLSRDTEGYRFGQLTGMRAVGPAGRHLGRVVDARFERGLHGRLVIRSLRIGRGRPGSRLGYDRRDQQGPWLVRAVVRRLQRDTGVVDMDAAQILWNRGEVRLTQLPHREPGHAVDR